VRTLLITLTLVGGALVGAACTEVPTGSNCWYDHDGLLVSDRGTGPDRCYRYRDDQENNWQFPTTTTTTVAPPVEPVAESSTTTTTTTTTASAPASSTAAAAPQQPPATS